MARTSFFGKGNSSKLYGGRKLVVEQKVVRYIRILLIDVGIRRDIGSIRLGRWNEAAGMTQLMKRRGRKRRWYMHLPDRETLDYWMSIIGPDSESLSTIPRVVASKSTCVDVS